MLRLLPDTASGLSCKKKKSQRNPHGWLQTPERSQNRSRQTNERWHLIWWEEKQFKEVRNYLLGNKGVSKHLLHVLWGGQISFSGLETNTGCPQRTEATQ